MPNLRITNNVSTNLDNLSLLNKESDTFHNICDEEIALLGNEKKKFD